jgi:NAD(P)-dependent dehydrogenase (short-subunit alcohol dehydrogenase family)
MERLKDRVAVVTGAASGIGRALVRRFASEGMHVVLADVEAGPLAEVEKELAASGAQVLARVCDVAREDSVRALADAAVVRFGAVHLVCNNAGVVTAGPTHELSQQDWDWVMGVNLWGPIYGVRAFLPILLKQDEAHILSTASTAGLVAGAAIAPYNVSKFGVVALMETLARELASTKVGVSVLCPGPINTRIPQSERNRPADKQVHSETAEERRFYAAAGPMLAGGMDPAEVAGLVVRAIRENRFWILTHPEFKQVLRKRVELLTASDALIPPRPKA